MAVPQSAINPSWRSIPNVSLYPGETIRFSLRRYQARQDATITISPIGNPPSWVTIHEDGTIKEVVIVAPTSLSGGQSYRITLDASAFVTPPGTTVHRSTSFTINISTPIQPAFTATDQAAQAGVAWSVDLNSFRTAGEPAISYRFAQGFTPPSWVTLNGSTLTGTPPLADYNSPTNRENFRITGSNVGGDANFNFNLDIARSVGPGIASIPDQYATQGVRYSYHIGNRIAGTPKPTISAVSVPAWLHIGSDGSFSGQPSGYTANQTETVTIRATNVVAHVDYTFTLYVKVGSDTFTELRTGSPISVADNQLRGLAASATRLYYSTDNDHGTVYATDHSGTAQTSENITLNTANAGNTSPIEGIAVDGSNLYVLGGTGTQYVYKYNVDGTYIGVQNVSGPARAIAIIQIGGNKYLAVLRTTGVVQIWSILFPGTQAGPQNALGYNLTEAGVSASQWQSFAYDSLDGKVYAGATNPSRAFLYAFDAEHGGRDSGEAIQLDRNNNDPRGAAYIDDTMYVAQGTARGATGQVYIYNSIARVLPVPDQEGFDGEMWSLDLAPYLANSITVTFKSGTSPPSWLSITNNVLSGTLPAVSRSRQDDVYNLQLTATHVDRSTDFTVQLTVKYVENPTWGNIPAITLDQHVIPNIPSPNPPLVLTTTVHLADYISNYSRAGSLAFTVTDSEGTNTRPRLSDRELDGVTINDVLTLRSPATLPQEETATASFNLVVEASNQIGTARSSLPVDVHHLALPVLQRLPSQSVTRDHIDSFDLSTFATGMPTPTFALGTSNPRLDDDIVQITSNSNGHWTIRPNPQLEIASTVYSINVIATNRVGTTNRNFQLTVLGVPHVDPNIAPEWRTTDLTFNVNTGATLTIDLTTLIVTARPQPTFSIFNDRELRDVGGRASISGNILTITISSDLDEDLTEMIHITARNAAGSSEIPLAIKIKHVFAPTWQPLPAQNLGVGDKVNLDLNSYVRGIPTATIAFNPVPTGPISTAVLTNGVLTWTVPDTITTDTALPIHLRATNSIGHADSTLSISVITDAAPVWSDDPITISAIEGDTEEYDFIADLTAGSPPPVLSLGIDASDIPANFTFQGTVLTITPTSDFVTTEVFTFSVIARNSSGMATKTGINLRIIPTFTDDEHIRFSMSDYEEIRKLVDTTLTVDLLADEIIAADTIVGAAIAWGIEVMPANIGFTRTLEELTAKRRAILLRAAGNLSISVRRTQPVSETQLEISEQELQLLLFAQADIQVAIANRNTNVASAGDTPEGLFIVIQGDDGL